MDLLWYKTDNNVRNYCVMLLSNSSYLMTDKPTRITSSSATLIDQIISNDNKNDAKNGIALFDIRDTCFHISLPKFDLKQQAILL